MAEFLEIIAGARQICDSIETCDGCQFKNMCNIISMSDSAAKEVERQVLEWQKEHRPPTWAEYLNKIGVIPRYHSDPQDVEDALRKTRLTLQTAMALQWWGSAREEGDTDA